MLNRENETTTLEEDVITGAVYGAAAGALAKMVVGFKEGVVGGLLGGVVNRTLSHIFQNTGLSMRASDILAFAGTVLLDVGFLHRFGSDCGNAPIPYSNQDNMAMHHVVFYSALMLMINLYQQNKQQKHGFFQPTPAENQKPTLISETPIATNKMS